jgi:REP element-mobilizing transposase RayT
MAVYLFTFHAYRSWNADKPQGYVRRGEGILPTDPNRAELYNRNANHPPIEFDQAKQRVLIDATREACSEKGWRLHQACATASHLHILISWDGFREWAEVSRTLKRLLGAALSKSLDRPGPWFSRGGSRRRVIDRDHFDHLMTRYLPNHKGVSWREGDP